MEGTPGTLAAVILAAGHGKRMKSDLPKVLHEVGGIPMVIHVVNQARSSGAEPIVAVVGHKRELVIPVVEAEGVKYAVQEQQLGTGHAVQSAQSSLEGFEGDILVLSGDVPLLSHETIDKLLEYHREQGAVATVVTAVADDPTGYGRILRGDDGLVLGIREHKDCSDEELRVREINSGIYLFRAAKLFEALKRLKNDNAQGEYYLTDVFADFFRDNLPVGAFKGDFTEITGVNSPEDLSRVEDIWRAREGNS
ncbi:NTP transferase domain-containing protein [bacterium]|nr:NTP transferase domain-containing protein [bacterium]